jgi:MFS family permease
VNPRRYLPLILAITGMGVLTFQIVSPALPDLADSLGVSRSVIGMVQGAVAIPGIFLAIFIGYLADRRGRRFIAVTSLVLFGIAGTAAFFARSFWALVALRGIQGIGTSGILSLGVILIGDLFPPGRERRAALGINSAGLTLTGMVSPIIGGVLAGVDPFAPFLVFSTAIPLALLARRLPSSTPVRPPPPMRHVGDMFRALRERGRLGDFLSLLPFAAFALVVFAGLGFTTTPLYLESEFSIGASARGGMQALLSVGSTTGSLNTARLTERFGAGRIFSVGFTSMTTGFAVLAFAPSLPVAGAGLVLLGLGLGLAFPLLQDLVTSSVTGRHRGAAVGVFVMAVRTGQSFGPVLASAMAVTPGARFSYGIAGVLSGLVAVAWRPLRAAAGRMVQRFPERNAS